MTACSGVVHYDTQNTAPTTNLEFRHALTAVRFAVGENLSWGAIDYIEIRNALSKGRYNLSDKFDGTGAGWDATTLDEPKTFTLTPTPVISTKKNPGVIITGTSNDEYTFYMIPQTLTGKGIEAYVHFTDGKTITATLKGEWKAGTTKTYKLSNTTSNWNYVLNIENPSVAAYNTTTTDKYKITSFRQAPDGTKYPVKWEVVGYDANDDDNFNMSEKPDWLTLSKTTGDGGTAADQGTATLTTSVVDSMAIINDALKEHQLGTSGNPYDLSTNGSTDLSKRNTANCYLISHPGYYKIPLVYGNAIKNGTTNESAYKTSNSGTGILSVFKDHNDQEITDPWITKTNGGVNVPVGTKLIWADEPGLVTAYTIVGSGDQAYLRFHVPATIKNGNAVLAVIDASGDALWSWHLWFTPKNVLDKTEVTNSYNVKYKFSEVNLGWKYTKYNATSYGNKQSIKVKVRQTIANGGTRKEAVITITRTGFKEYEGYSTYYQWGRKDAFPGTDNLVSGSLFKIITSGEQSSLEKLIKYPEKFYNHYTFLYLKLCNLWSAATTVGGFNDEKTIKTIYDPNPTGFKIPPSNAFSNFLSLRKQWNPNKSWTIWTNNSRKNTIDFFALGCRAKSTGGLFNVNSTGWYWSASIIYPYDKATCLFFTPYNISPQDQQPYHSDGLSVRPVADE